MRATLYRLGEVCDITMGQAPEGSSYNTDGSGLPLVAGAGDLGNLIPSPSKYTTAATKISCQGDIILCIRATIGDTNWSDQAYCLGRGVAGLRANSKVLDQRFLWHFIGARRGELEARGTGSTFKQVSRVDIADWLIPIPALAEQQRIAAILDKVDTLRRRRQEAIRLTDDFLRAVFIDMFGAPGSVSNSSLTQPLGDVCRFYAGNSLPDGEPYTGQLDGVLHIKVGDMNLPGNESVVSTSREWSANGAGGIVAPEGAILIPKRGGAIATNKKRVLGRPCALDPNLMAISPGPGLRQELLFQWFKLFDLSTITSGSAIPQLNKGDLAPLRIVVPEAHQQDRFAAIAQRVTSVINRQTIQLGGMESACRALTDELLVV